MRTPRLLIDLTLGVMSALALVTCAPEGSIATSNANQQTVPEATSVVTNSTVKGALPYTLEFVPKDVPDADQFPALQGYSLAVSDGGTWLVVGGRHNQGLHTFATEGNNFPPKNRNEFLWSIDPHEIRATKVLDLKVLDPETGDPLMSTNQQYDYDRETGDWLILGGYGLDSRTQEMRTFPTLIRMNLKHVAKIAADSTLTEKQRQQAIAAEIEHLDDNFFAVTGGALRRLDGQFVIVFGQRFDGEYNPFEGSHFTQKYTEEVRFFTLKPGNLAIGTKGQLSSSDAGGDHPYHRRDLPVVLDIDPRTGNDRIAAFGGVFPPGVIGGYDYPVYITRNYGELQSSPDRSVKQRFSQYECPTVVVWDAGQKRIYHTFFGGISHYYYHFNEEQAKVYESVTKQGRNDGLPFIPAITTFLQKDDGSYEEYIAAQPIPGNKLHGTSVEFIPNFQLKGGKIQRTGVTELSAFAENERQLIGYVYGGIEADFPLPKQPNEGTHATNALYEVYLTRSPSSGIPASEGYEAVGDFSHHPKSE